MIKLFYAPGACSLAPHIVLQEAKIPHELVRVDLKNKTYPGGDYKSINPKGSVPAIQLDNGNVLTEASVTVQYIADQNPEAGLIPKAGTWERYRCQEWLNFISTEIHKGFGPLWKPDTPEEYKKISINNLGQRFDYLNAHFAKNAYLLGTSFSVADAYLFTVTNWSSFLKIDLKPWSNLQGFMGRIKERAGVMAAMKAEEILK